MSAAIDLSAAVQRSGSSFLAGMRVLPKARREGMFALYAFCRTVDDIADAPAAPAQKLAGLLRWRQLVAQLYHGDAPPPAAGTLEAALRQMVRRFDVREDDLLAIIAGMEMDAGPPIIAPEHALLDLYCDRVASAVGRASVRIFGCLGDALAPADQVAHHLGRALQLTNILRDLDEDAQRGRLYLPREKLLAAGLNLDAPPLEIVRHPHCRIVCRAVAEEAENHFARAHEAMRACPRRAMKPARLMAAYYFRLLQKLKMADWQDTTRRLRLPAWEKLLLGLRHGIF